MQSRGIVFLAALLAAAIAAAGPRPAAEHASQGEKSMVPGELLVYIGTYTNNERSKGIYVSRLTLATGRLTDPELAAESTNPSFLAVHPDGRHLYAANEVSSYEGRQTGAVSAFAIDRDSGLLTPLNQQSSGGAGPAHLIVDRTGRVVLVANYGGGSVAALPIRSDGHLAVPASVNSHTGSSIHPTRQAKPHAHSINVDESNRFAYAADLGIDKMIIYKLDPAAATLTPHTPASVAVAPGSGPRHFAFHPTRPYAYLLNEMLLTITAFNHDATSGALSEVLTLSTLPPGVDAQSEFSGAEVQVHPSGRFLYASNRGHDSITVFAIDQSTGRLTFVGSEPTQGSFPRGFGIDPTGRLLLAGNQRSHTVVAFRIDQATGQLTPTGQSLSIGTPVCVKFVQ
ncbi:MAG: lactonase family protein [Acidobacteria bacterium]|nr:lactonase family protein [Acidobacteriota bacterium]